MTDMSIEQYKQIMKPKLNAMAVGEKIQLGNCGEKRENHSLEAKKVAENIFSIERNFLTEFSFVVEDYLLNVAYREFHAKLEIMTDEEKKRLLRKVQESYSIPGLQFDNPFLIAHQKGTIFE